MGEIWLDIYYWYEFLLNPFFFFVIMIYYSYDIHL